MGRETFQIAQRLILLLQKWGIPYTKNFFIIPNLNLLSSIKTFPFVLSLQAFIQTPSPAFFQAPFRHRETALGSPSSWIRALPASLHRRGVPPLIISVLLYGPAVTHPPPSHPGDPRAGCSTPHGVTHQARDSRLPCWCKCHLFCLSFGQWVPSTSILDDGFWFSW